MPSMLRWTMPVAMGLLVLAPTASAGYKTVDAVQVELFPGNAGSAAGSLGSTRRTGSSSGYIGCWLEGTVPGPSALANTGFCEASDGTDSGTCRLDPLNFEYFMSAMQSITSSSWIWFTWESRTNPDPLLSGRICTGLLVMNGSEYEPLQ